MMLIIVLLSNYSMMGVLRELYFFLCKVRLQFTPSNYFYLSLNIWHIEGLFQFLG